jgi:uncharacterized protein YciI
MFAFHSRYTAPLEEVDKHLDAHRAFLRTLIDRKILVCSGPQVPRTGGFILINAPAKDEAVRIMADDPYVIHNLALYEVIEFDLKSCVEGFRELLNVKIQ